MNKSGAHTKILIGVSLAINIILLVIGFVAIFGSSFDYIMFQKSVPNVCQWIKETAETEEPESESFLQFCEDAGY